jgi:hypothetical protein
MSTIGRQPWIAMRDKDSIRIEKALKPFFPLVEAYRYSSVSIRVRVVDERFSGLSIAARDDLVAKHLTTLPKKLQADIMMLLAATPNELNDRGWIRYLTNLEFENPSPSIL